MDDLIYQICVRKTIEAGLADSKAGKFASVEEVRKKIGLKKRTTFYKQQTQC